MYGVWNERYLLHMHASDMLVYIHISMSGMGMEWTHLQN